MNLKSLITTLALIGALFGTSCSTQTQAYKPESHDPKIIAELGVIYQVAELDNAPKERVRIAARYPYDQMRRGINGRAVCEIIINSNGEAVSVAVKAASHQAFAEAAKTALLKWKFSPGKKDGQAVSCRLELPMDFTTAKN